jgi:hypothetical protein
MRLTARLVLPRIKEVRLAQAKKQKANMAIDGIDILESDFAIDTQNEIFALYDSKTPTLAIIAHLKNERKKLSNAVDIEIFLSASCLSLWQIGVVDADLQNELESIVNIGADAFWRKNLNDNHFDEKTWQKRGDALKKLSAKIVTPNTKVRKQKSHKTKENSYFEKGDVLALKIENYFYSLIFENFYQHNSDAYFCFVTNTYRENFAPTIDELLLTEIPIIKNKNNEIGVRKLAIFFDDIVKLSTNFTKIGKLILDVNAEKTAFTSQVSVNGLGDLQQQIENINLGNKTELYNCYTI